MNATANNEIIGLKTEVKRQVGLRNWQEDKANFNQTHLINAWKALYASGMTDELTEMIWEYIMTADFVIWVKARSDTFGIYSTIGEYESKKGVKSLAHFSENGHYIGSVKNLGDKPVGYEGNFRIARATFSLDLSKLPTLKSLNGVYNLANLFQPIQVARKTLKIKSMTKIETKIEEESEDEDEDDIPISKLLEKMKIKK